MQRLYRKAESTKLQATLQEAAAVQPDWYVSESWMEANIDRFVSWWSAATICSMKRSSSDDAR